MAGLMEGCKLTSNWHRLQSSVVCKANVGTFSVLPATTATALAYHSASGRELGEHKDPPMHTGVAEVVVAREAAESVKAVVADRTVVGAALVVAPERATVFGQKLEVSQAPGAPDVERRR